MGAVPFGDPSPGVEPARLRRAGRGAHGRLVPLAARAVCASYRGLKKFVEEPRGSRPNRQSPSAHRRRPGDGARRDHAARGRVPCRGRAGWRPVQADQADGRNPGIAQGQGAGQGSVELLADRLRPGLRPHHRRIRLSRRGNGLVAARLRGVQLLRPRHRQHGSARAVRLERAEGALAARSARGARALGLSHDRAGRRLVGCDQHRHGRAPRGRRMGAQRREMVVVRRRRSALLALYHHDAHRPRRRAAFTPFDAVRPGCGQGHRDFESDEGLWRRRRAARTHAYPFSRRASARTRMR